MTAAARFSLLAGLIYAALPAHAGEMPKDFVYLRDIDPSIEQDMRYAGPYNFTGKPVPGYGGAECVLVREAAEALKAVQSGLKAKQLALKVYDCYRPARAVAAFVDWSKQPDNLEAKATYYPNLDKTGLFSAGYIATRSGHSRGATVDLTLVPLDAADNPGSTATNAIACTAPQGDLAPDGSEAMGTTFDCFDVKANTAAAGLTEVERKNRAVLVEAMRARGFNNYAKEWWHFTLSPEPYPDTFFDFPIEPAPARNR
jgi:D-alanyl-D-alanine dipeptidase